MKKCFKAPEGWVFCGIDFASLEDVISAVTTKDPNKLKIYEGIRQYELTINGETHLIEENTMIEYEGQILTGDQLYEKLSNSQS